MTILLVDDEMAVVEIMKRAIDWEGIGIDTLYTAYNAVSARNVLTENAVDIMVCDIEMPKESGLELIRWVREQRMELECIILTAYPDFNYAKEAISLQISNYLLKPVVYKELSRAVENSIDTILRKRAEKKYKNIGLSILSDKRAGAKRFLNKIIWEDIPASMIEKEAETYELDLNELKNVDMIIFHCTNIRELLDKNGKIILFAFENVMDELFTDSVNFCVEYTPLILCRTEQEEQLTERCRRFIQAAEQYLKSQMYAFVMQNINVEELSTSYDLLRNVVEMSIYDRERIQFVQRDTLIVEPDRLLFDKDKWKKLLQLKGTELIEKQAQKELQRAEEEGVLNREYLRVYQQELLRVYYRISDAEVDITAEDLHAFEKASDSVKDMEEWILHILSGSMLRRRDQEKQSDMEKARNYLEAHYNEPISREDIEKHMHLNRDYLNRVFKSATGYSLMEYVQNYRIMMARHMLTGTDESITQICFKVGYDSPPYFSKIFKKLVGQTPLEYRNQNQNAVPD